ncbi:MAG TPA: flavin reductase family protein [Thermohalobaculum sp.]|nr:flavin reductase family protein [Thermohalobaculum sp.]
MFYRPEEGHGLPFDPFKAIVVPRPIGWISTLDAEGRANLAPYSFFNGCGDAPPMVMFAQTGRKSRPEAIKDSVANIRATGEFATNMVTHALAERMNATSGTHPAGVDEFAQAGLAPAPCRTIAPPRVAEAPVALECRVVRILDDLPSWREHAFNIVVIGEVVGVHIDERYLTEEGRLDVLALSPVARMGYKDYTSVTEKFEMDRPVVEPQPEGAAKR